MNLYQQMPEDWQEALKDYTDFENLARLQDFLEKEHQENREIFPSEKDLFRAFVLTPFRSVKVLLLGQDPYHNDGQACGLAFTVPTGIAPPPSLRNILKEFQADLGCSLPENVISLEPWARQGVLLINAVLSVRAHQAGSHAGHGWEIFTDGVIRALNDRAEPLVFILWGNYAGKKARLIDSVHHGVIQSAHPSPLSAFRGFFGSRPFSRTNQLLGERNVEPVDWTLP